LIKGKYSEKEKKENPEKKEEKKKLPPHRPHPPTPFYWSKEKEKKLFLQDPSKLFQSEY
jgi:hypothetical protein